MGADNLVSDVDGHVTSRLYDENFTKLYFMYSDVRLREEMERFMRRLSDHQREILAYGLMVSISKKDPVFIYALGDVIGHKQRAIISMAVDVLWALGLEYDDIADNDSIRGGSAAAWVVYGDHTVMGAVWGVFGELLEYLSSVCEPRVSTLCDNCIKLAIDSIAAHKSLVLGKTSIDDVLANYVDRMAFHTTFPLEVFRHSRLASDSWIDLALLGMMRMDCAGQIANDVKDFLSGSDGFSDVAGGVVSVPIVYMYDAMDDEDRLRFVEMYGHGRANCDPEFLIGKLISTKAALKSLSMSREYYESSLACFGKVFEEGEYLEMSSNWIAGRLEQLDALLEKCS